jgi:hypothetical protein
MGQRRGTPRDISELGSQVEVAAVDVTDMLVRVRDMRLAVRLGGAFALVCSIFAASLGMALWAIDRQSDAASRSIEL